MAKKKDNIEYIVWTENSEGYKNIVIHAVGFNIKENEKSLFLALNNNYGEYTDIQEIEKKAVIEKHSIIIQD